MTSLMLDTSAYSAFKRGHQEAISTIQTAPKILIPIIVIGELLSGFKAGSKQDQNHLELDAFLQAPRVSIVPLQYETAERYSAIYVFLRKSGLPIPTNDLWIAACAMEHSAKLLTSDKHFLYVPQIIVRQLALNP